MKGNQGSVVPWVEKYRPISLDGLSSHKEIIGILKNFIKEKNFLIYFFTVLLEQVKHL